MYSWDNNEYGQLGLGDQICRNEPELVNFDKKVKSVHCGLNATMAIAGM